MTTPLKNTLSIVMPIRIDCPDRLRNLQTTLKWLKPTKYSITILEADKESHASSCKDENVEYIFIKDESPVFHRTHYINTLLFHNKSQITAVWDTDIIVDHEQICEAVNNISTQGCTIAYPYNGDYILLPQNTTLQFADQPDLQLLKNLKLSSVFARPFCGGAFLVNRERYLSIGGENEHFYGWGPEDAERLRRAQIMGHKVKWTNIGAAYHLFHPRNTNSESIEALKEMRAEFVKICSLTHEKLNEYIQTWRR